MLPATAEAARRHRAHGGRHASSGAWGVNDPRYAALIMNPQTGEVYHEKNADARRYPASLTKMMTLYLLFEALEDGRVSLNARLHVSDYATTMPQTNLSLSAGDEIPVDTAIKALVVRSANDVAVVVAEALAGDVDNFATVMTNKAHALGMRDTQFQNPNGLPNSEQYTTARDMAKLGIALKRDFPKYYWYFSVREFSWAGTSYYTHNRVMLRYAGVDGIKTGFIGNSGFNLVTSCKRGGRPLIGVVMGGSTGAWRDNRMIELLNQGYQIIASRGAARGKPEAENLPTGKDGAESTGADTEQDTAVSNPRARVKMTLPVKAQGETDTAEESSADEDSSAIPSQPLISAAPPATPSPFQPPSAATPATNIQKPGSNAVVAAAKVKAPAVITPPAVPAGPQKPAVPVVSPLAAPPASAAATAVPPEENKVPAAASAAMGPAVGEWGIQVGAFASKRLAQQAAQRAYRKAISEMHGARLMVAPPEKNAARVYRARLDRLTEIQATKACQILTQSGVFSCFTYKMDAKPN